MMKLGNITPLFALVFGGALVLTACGKDPQTTSETASTTNNSTSSTSTTTETTGTASNGSTTTATGTTGTTTDSGTGTDSATTTGCSFLECMDGGGPGVNECDIWLQDCPDNEKCMPWANDGGNAWNATKCSMLDPNAALVGDECDGGGVSGEDNCELGSMCYYVDSETNKGVCVPFCTGSQDNPMCGNLQDECSISNNGVLILCRKSCNPLLQDCEGNAACLPAAGSDKFVCIVDASGEDGQPGDPCEFLNSCDPGLFCAGADFVPGCLASGCCTEFCDLQDVDPDSMCSLNGMGVTCEAYYEPGNEPPGLENVGACILPP
ncbi:MAG: ribulose phosphate epimerase [Myxococcales bacterium]|nr:ribulose phosphate epimerase [Myxococcales bacterium]